MTTTPGERFVRRAAPFALPVLLVVALLLLLGLARQRLQRTPRFLVDPSACEVVARPDWLPPDHAEAIAGELSARLVGQASLLRGPDLEAWVRAAATASPWIAGVEALEPRFPGQADLRLLLRVPVLEVGGGILLASDGQVLGPGPLDYQPAPLGFSGLHRDEDYLECAAAAGEILPFRDELELLGLSLVSVGPGPEGTVQFQAEGGALVNWGRSARKSAFSHLDLSPEARVANLRQVLADNPGLHGLERVQVWTDRPVVSR